VDRTALHALARRQHGLLTRAQLLAVITEHQLEHATRTGEFELVRRCVYRVGGAPWTWDQQVLAACLAGRTGTVASFRTAARV
jgi:hypothetical protein